MSNRLLHTKVSKRKPLTHFPKKEDGHNGDMQIAKKLMDAVGGTADYIAFVRGKYDVVVRVEVKDHETAMGLVLAIKASGALEEADYLEEIDMPSVVTAAQKAASAYTAAG